MPNASEINLEDEFVRVLVYGDSGTGKTMFAGTFPDPFLFDFDNGVKTLAGQNVEYESYACTAAEFTRFQSDMNKVLKLVQEGKVKSIILDSVTTYSEMLLKYILKSAGKPEDANPEIQHWGMQMNTIVSTINKLKGFSCNLVVIAHEQLEKDDLTGMIRGTPLVTGKLAGKIGLYFDEVYRTITRGGNATTSPEYRIRTKAAENFTAKSRIDGMLVKNGFTGMPPLLKPSYAEIRKYMDQLTTGVPIEKEVKK